MFKQQQAAVRLPGHATERSRRWRKVKRHGLLYVLLFPSILYFFVFNIVPYYGLSIAFKDFSPFIGIADSKWVGLKHFERIFVNPDFYRLLSNTVLIHMYKLIFGFPVPIIFALLLNEVRHTLFKRSVQTITYFPHFLSWVVYGGIVVTFLTPSGVVNGVLKAFDMAPINFLIDKDFFRPMLVVTAILKDFGWSAIIYLAALAGVNQELYQAAKVDGANRLQQMWSVTLPGILPTISLMLIMNLSHILDAGFEQIFVLMNPTVYEVGDIIDTYVYRMGLERGQFSLATAVGLFKGVIGFVLIVSANALLRKLDQRSIW
ncbi:putative aldouronate transport system permease protein [Paenibacillus sp. UNCCL117]|uniref:ABC transporter permease n=1 Tax=unclassified Paenibacillus TaxID=185978 RepID=UPI00088C056F|nr:MULTISPECIES: ABC transporter permease subunit [unclassified Paenibacillus]SDE45807.1 putative aldouronate transport system permease protein [Paenibacillus sp. cl123]SFW65993.1 putative aldouronate transport system permease protein [Paenibacillus sp. UNCCL117]